jgi:hypothetical protein
MAFRPGIHVVAPAVLVVAGLLVGGCGPRENPLSPRTTVEADVEGVHFTIEFGAPSKRDREIWGALVPWGERWMPGADTATSITTTAAISLGTLVLPAGSYSIYTLPAAGDFVFIINQQTGQDHLDYDQSQDYARLLADLTMLGRSVEQLTFAVEAHPDGGGDIKLIWDDREYAVPFTVPPPGE